MGKDLSEREQHILSEIRRAGSVSHDITRGSIAALRSLKKRGLVELEYNERGNLVWRLAGTRAHQVFR